MHPAPWSAQKGISWRSNEQKPSSRLLGIKTPPTPATTTTMTERLVAQEVMTKTNTPPNRHHRVEVNTQDPTRTRTTKTAPTLMAASLLNILFPDRKKPKQGGGSHLGPPTTNNNEATLNTIDAGATPKSRGSSEGLPHLLGTTPGTNGDPADHTRGISDPVPLLTASTDIEVDKGPCPSTERHGSPGPRSVRFASERVNRASRGTGLYQPFILYSKEGWRSAASVKPQAIKPFCPATGFQNGDYQGSLSANKQERLPYIARPSGCIPPHPDPSGFPSFSSVPMAGQDLPVPGTSIWPVTGTLGIHESLATSAMVGKESRDMLDGLLGRPPDRSSDQGAFDQAHSHGQGKARGTRLLDKNEQIPARTNTDDRTPGISDRYTEHDLVSPHKQDLRHL